MADKATAVSFRYGDRSAHEVFRGVTAEITVDLDTPTLWVHTGDSSKPGTPYPEAFGKSQPSSPDRSSGIPCGSPQARPTIPDASARPA